jgi:hypothetical protein
MKKMHVILLYYNISPFCYYLYICYNFNNKNRLWYFYHLMLLTTVVTQTEHSTVMSHNIYKSCMSCLYSMELLSLPGRHQGKHSFILNIFPLFLIMDSAYDKYNYAQNGLQNIRKKSTIVLNLNITWPDRRNNLVRYL